eukprot:c4735_g1_i1.p1 GENE.c4735_g1_i1~~c4735_g1_i1.p1  ORF type:complete len:439 (+),score=58.87 c4735_g1_i1:53-1318(+)
MNKLALDLEQVEPPLRMHRSSGSISMIFKTSRRFSDFYGEMNEEDDEQSKVDIIKSAIDVWSQYGAYREWYLILSLPELCVVLAYSVSPPSPTLIFLWIDVFFHFIRAAWSFLLFIITPDRIRDYESTRNKFLRAKLDRALVALHFLFVIVCGSYFVHTMDHKFSSIYNMALYIVVMTSCVEAYYLVDPLLTQNICDVWENRTNESLSETFKKEKLSDRQNALYTDRLLKACLKMQEHSGQKRKSFNSFSFAAIAVAETILVAVQWKTFSDCERGHLLRLWMCIDLILNTLVALGPLPSLSIVIDKMYSELPSPNPLTPFRALLAIHIAHFTCGLWGAILLSWFADCIPLPVFRMVSASVVVVLSLELLTIVRVGLRFDHVLFVYYLWALAPADVVSSLLHIAFIPKHSSVIDSPMFAPER